MLTNKEFIDRVELMYPNNELVTDLRKLVFDDNEWSMYRLLLELTDSQVVAAYKALKGNGVEIDEDSISRGQLKSKMWVIETLHKLDLPLGDVILCAGWYGILATLMFEYGLKVESVLSIDIDPSTVEIADKFNGPWVRQQWRFKAIEGNIHDVNYEKHEWCAWSNKSQRMSNPLTIVPNTVINTSCEHIENFDDWFASIPDGVLVILQSNNFEDVKEHVNISKTLDDFAAQTPLTEELYSGELELPDYTRFMRIGVI